MRSYRLIEAGAIRVFTDIVSGQRFDRPALAELINHASRHRGAQPRVKAGAAAELAREALRLGEHRGLLKRRWKTVLPTNSAEDPNFLLGNAARFGSAALDLARDRWAQILTELDDIAMVQTGGAALQ